ncbi:MAG: folylpolyglutamate synthase/dihydrofolate synthase family protein [Calditrichia bacterium]
MTTSSPIQNAQQATKFIYDLQYSGIKLGLKNIQQLLEALGNPQNRFKSIHLAGTNGKGSTAAYIFYALQAAGYRVGLYTSPHLVRFNERIRVNDRLIPDEYIVNFVLRHQELIREISPTFFEATTALAFQYLAEQNVDIAVIETGLGGRLDATNIITPLLSLITPIGMDHSQYLGETIRQIAAEKAGIIKTEVPILTNNTDPEVLDVLKETAIRMNAPFIPISPDGEIKVIRENFDGATVFWNRPGGAPLELTTRFPGLHQIENLALALNALNRLSGFSISDDALRKGIAAAYWPGRLHIVNRQPLVIVDVAHNPPGFETVRNYCRRYFAEKPLRMILGLSHDKDFEAILDIVAELHPEVSLVEKFSEKGMPAEKLFYGLKKRGFSASLFPDFESAFQHQLATMQADEILLIVGSHFLAEKFYKKYNFLDFNDLQG